MTLEKRAESVARKVVSTAAVPYSVAVTAHQQDKVIQLAARLVLDELKDWLEQLCPHVLPKSPLGDAIGYTLRQWGPLTTYLEDGRLEIDNNRTERQMRAVAVGQKHWIFAGSAEGGRRAETIYSMA